MILDNGIDDKNLDNLPILIFNATTPLAIGGVRRFSEELEAGLLNKELQTNVLFGNRQQNALTSFIKLTKQFKLSLKTVAIIHFVTLSPYNIPFIVLARIRGKGILVTYHGNYRSELSILKKPHLYLLHCLADTICRLASDMIISPSNYLLAQLGLYKNTIVIRNPINLRELDSISTTKPESFDGNIILVASSNFNIQKKSNGILALLRAMDDIIKDFDAVKLFIFGEGTHLKEIKSKNNHPRDIIFMGFSSCFREYLRLSDCYIHISGLDNQPYSIIEAMLQEKVIVCNDIGGILEMIDTDNNYVVTMDPLSISGALRSLIGEIRNDPEKLKKKGKQNRSYALKLYSTEEIISNYITIYQKIVQKRRKTS